MQPSIHLKHNDLRSVYLMLGECCELGQTPLAWFTRCHERLARLAGTGSTVFLEGHIDAALCRRGPDANDHVSLFGWPSPEAMRTIQEFFENHVITRDPAMQYWEQNADECSTVDRTGLARDREWYNSAVYCEYYRALDVDHFIVSTRPLENGNVSLIQLWRSPGEPRFSEREVAILSVAHYEIVGLAREGRLLFPRQTEKTALTRRQMQVLQLAGDGLAEKEIASCLGLSVHTVHDYVKALHQTLGVSTRGELVAAACESRPRKAGPA